MKKIIIALLLAFPAFGMAQALDTLDTDYDGLLSKYKNHTIKPERILTLLLQAKDRKEDGLSHRMAKTYKTAYLENNNLSKILGPKLIPFFWYYTDLVTVKDKMFNYLYRAPEQADGLLGERGLSLGVTDKVIARTFMSPLTKSSDSNSISLKSWDNTEKIIARKFDAKTAHRIALATKTDYYLQKKDWPNYITFNLEKIESEQAKMEDGWMSRMGPNNFIYNVVFPHSTDKAVLTKCIKIMEGMLPLDPESHGHIDTYACILYKAGFKEKAIAEEQKAVALAKGKGHKESVQEYENKIRKMKNNKPFWEEMGQ